MNAQKNHFNFLAGYGPSYFFNDPSLHRYMDHSGVIGINYLWTKKDQAFAFNPGINWQMNKYHSVIEGKRLAHVTQGGLGLALDVLMRLSKKSYLRIGLFINTISFDNIFISDTRYNGRAYYAFGNDEMRKTYFQTTVQAGLTAGLSFPFQLFKRALGFGLKLQQFASPLVSSDFILSKSIAGKDTKVLSTKARPTMLLFVLEFSLQKKEKKKKNAEEEE